jgi:hypothetical protein
VKELTVVPVKVTTIIAGQELLGMQYNFRSSLQLYSLAFLDSAAKYIEARQLFLTK